MLELIRGLSPSEHEGGQNTGSEDDIYWGDATSTGRHRYGDLGRKGARGMDGWGAARLVRRAGSGRACAGDDAMMEGHPFGPPPPARRQQERTPTPTPTPTRASKEIQP